jgi:hypothetical protein
VPTPRARRLEGEHRRRRAPAVRESALRLILPRVPGGESALDFDVQAGLVLGRLSLTLTIFDDALADGDREDEQHRGEHEDHEPLDDVVRGLRAHDRTAFANRS